LYRYTEAEMDAVMELKQAAAEAHGGALQVESS
jgi:hypothetical protein